MSRRQASRVRPGPPCGGWQRRQRPVPVRLSRTGSLATGDFTRCAWPWGYADPQMFMVRAFCRRLFSKGRTGQSNVKQMQKGLERGPVDEMRSRGVGKTKSGTYVWMADGDVV